MNFRKPKAFPAWPQQPSAWSQEGPRLGHRAEPQGGHQKGLACVIPCQLCGSVAHFYGGISRVQFCVAESLFHGQRRGGTQWEQIGKLLKYGILGSHSAAGLRSPSIPPLKGVWELSSDAQITQQQGANQIQDRHRDERSRLGVGKPGFESQEALLLTGSSLVRVSSSVKEEFSLLHGL